MAFEKLLAPKINLQSIQELVLISKQYIEKCMFGSYELYLFGSATTQKMSEASDLDFLIVSENSDCLIQSKKNYYSSRPKIPYPIDAVFITKEYFEKQKVIGGLPMLVFEEGVKLH